VGVTISGAGKAAAAPSADDPRGTFDGPGVRSTVAISTTSATMSATTNSHASLRTIGSPRRPPRSGGMPEMCSL
jgi:hypothetical protein